MGQWDSGSVGVTCAIKSNRDTDDTETTDYKDKKRFGFGSDPKIFSNNPENLFTNIQNHKLLISGFRIVRAIRVPLRMIFVCDDSKT